MATLREKELKKTRSEKKQSVINQKYDALEKKVIIQSEEEMKVKHESRRIQIAEAASTAPHLMPAIIQQTRKSGS